jgi:putative MATE family efflux protein
MAAVNLAAPLLLILGAVSTTVGAGGASLVSRCLGANDPAGAARAAGNAFILFWLSAVTVSIVGLLALEPLLTVLGTTSGTRDLTRSYIVVLLCGTLVSTGFSSLVRAEGRLRYATALWLTTILIQMLLDPLFIYGLDLGVRGAALGNIGGQAVSGVMSLWFFFGQRQRPYRISARDLRPHGPTLRALLGIGAPSFLAGLGATLLTVLVNNILAGAVALAAYAVCVRVLTFAAMPHLGISQGLQPVVAYNAGRRLFARVDRARILALRAVIGYGLIAALSIAALANPLAAAFVDDPLITPVTAKAMRILAIGTAAAGVAPLVSAYFQSRGRAAPSYLLSAGTLLLIKFPLVLALARFGDIGVWLGLTVGEIASALAALFLLRR